MKTNEKMIALILAMGGKAFDQMDWECYAGCESDNPHIAHVGDFTVIADEDHFIIIDKDGDETLLQEAFHREM